MIGDSDRSERRKRYRTDAINAYGGRCACCGETHIDMLTIDHVNNDGNVHRKELGRKDFYIWLRDNGYPKDRFQCLCYNCNESKHVNGGICSHKIVINQRRIIPETSCDCRSAASRPMFEDCAGKVLKECVDVFEERGGQYGDNYGTMKFLIMDSVAKDLGLEICNDELRLLSAAALVDLKYWRFVSQTYKEDNLIDGINYSAFLIEAMRRHAKNKIKENTSEQNH